MRDLGLSRLVVVRHGATEWSDSGRHTGRTDITLTDAGRLQARGLRSVLATERFDRVFTSPLARARETCELAGYGERAEVTADLEEWDYGDYEGVRTEEIRLRRPGWDLFTDGCPGGESIGDVTARIDRFLALAALGPNSDASGIVFAHGHVLRVLFARVLSLSAVDGAHVVLDPARLGLFGFERERAVLRLWNATSLSEER